MALDIIAELEAIVDALDTAGIEYAVCGGLAMGILLLPRSTKDIDILVRREDVDRAKAVVKAIGFDIPARKMIFKQGSPDDRVSKIDPDTGDLLPLDLLIVVPVYESTWATRFVASYGDRKISVVSREGLATMKRLAGRSQDLVDLEKLEYEDDEET